MGELKTPVAAVRRRWIAAVVAAGLILVLLFTPLVNIVSDLLTGGAGGARTLMREFYTGEQSAATDLIFENTVSDNADEYEVDPYVEPNMGWKTDGKPAQSPTKVLADGMRLLLIDENVARAKKHAEWMLQNSERRGDGLFFPFMFDYKPKYPYSFSSPWVSGLTQGMALALFSYLYEATNEETYRDTAKEIYNSFKLPIEDGGFTRYEGDLVYFEEYPTGVPTRVLNGSYLCMFGLHDYAVICEDAEAMDLFQKAAARQDQLVDEYTLNLPEYPFPISAYSLAPHADEWLFRFRGAEPAFISGLSVYGDNGSAPALLGTQKVGVDGDDDVMPNTVYVWYDPVAMNWSAPGTENGISGRWINREKGKYNHSPFIAVIETEAAKKYDGIFVEIAGSDCENVVLEYYDGTRYIPLEKKGERYFLDKTAYSGREGVDPENYSYDARYIDDNYIFVKILADYTALPNLVKCEEAWRESVKLVPLSMVNYAFQVFDPKEEVFSVSGVSGVNSPNFFRDAGGEMQCILSKTDKSGTHIALYQQVAGEWADAGWLFSESYDDPFLYQEGGTPYLLMTSDDGIFRSKMEGGTFSEPELILSGRYQSPAVNRAGDRCFAVRLEGDRKVVECFAYSAGTLKPSGEVVTKFPERYEDIESISVVSEGADEYVSVSFWVGNDRHQTELYRIETDGGYTCMNEAGVAWMDFPDKYQPVPNLAKPELAEINSFVRQWEEGLYFVSYYEGGDTFAIRSGTFSKDILQQIAG